MTDWYRIEASSEEEATVYIYDRVGSSWFDEGVGAKAFARDLEAIKAPRIALRLNSPGGSVFEGQAIAAALTRHPARVTTYIDGLAASIATVIALAGDEVVAHPSALFMVHDPHAAAAGTADELRKVAGVLDKITDTLAATYTAKTGRPEAEVRAEMAAETWYTAPEALEAGYVDRIGDGEDLPAAAPAALWEDAAAGLLHPPAWLYPTTAAAEADTTPETPDPIEEPETPTEGDTVDESTTPEAIATAPHIPARVQDPFPYGPHASSRSLFRDMVAAKDDPEAARRASQAHTMYLAAQKTADVAEVIPPGYRPDLYEGELSYPTPVTSAFRRLGISDATPFKVPVFGSATGMSGDHVEGTNPTDGTLAFDEVVVTPKAVSGKYRASREMLDAANPALDSIILGAMREEYARDLEAYVVARVLAAATTGTAIEEATATANLVTELIGFDDARLAEADRVIVSTALFAALALEEDSTGRLKNPYLGPTNAAGSLGSGAQALSVVGQPVVKAWSLTASGAIVARSSDATVFTSPVLTWRWEEKDGPANIEFAHFGYAAVGVTRPLGVRKCAYTAAAPLAARSSK